MARIGTPDQFRLRELGLAAYPAGCGTCFPSEEQAGYSDERGKIGRELE
jgi:hypothetical protein